MDYKELKLKKVEIPDLSLPSPTAETKERKRSCRICNSQYKDVIESLYFTGINQTELLSRAKKIGVSTTSRQLKKHMSEHYAPKAGQKYIFDDDGSSELIDLTPNAMIGTILASHDNPMSIEAIVNVLLSQALQDIASGTIRVNSVGQIANLLSVVTNAEQKKFEREMILGNTNESIEDAYRQLQYIMTAIQKTVKDPKMLEALVTAAWSEGLDKKILDVGDIDYYNIEPIDEMDMSGALEKYGVE